MNKSILMASMVALSLAVSSSVLADDTTAASSTAAPAQTQNATKATTGQNSCKSQSQSAPSAATTGTDGSSS